MAEKKRKGRKAYLNDFHKNARGEYEYQGAVYEWKGEKGGLCKELILRWILCISMLIVLIAAGCLDAPGATNRFYVVLPYTISFVFGISTVWGVWRLFSGGNPLRSYIYDASIAQIPLRCIGTMVCAGAAILGEVIYLFKNGFEGKTAGILGFLFLLVIALVLSGILRKRVQKMPWEKKQQ